MLSESGRTALSCSDSNCSVGVGESGTTVADATFCVHLKCQRDIPVGPRSTLQIPLTFAPREMANYQQRCVVTARREDGLVWDHQLCAAAQHNGSVPAMYQCSIIRSLSSFFAN